MWSVAAHRGIVKGVSVAPHSANFFVTCGDDSRAKLWGLHRAAAVDAASSGEAEPLATFVGNAAFTGVDHHWSRQQFATSSETIQVWDHNRSQPVHAFKWGHDSTLSVRFNPAEPELLASTGRDRSVGLYDLRAGSSLKKVVLEAYCSAMAWNPREPMNFVSACEDGHLYSFDMRKLDRPTMIHKVCQEREMTRIRNRYVCLHLMMHDTILVLGHSSCNFAKHSLSGSACPLSVSHFRYVDDRTTWVQY